MPDSVLTSIQQESTWIQAQFLQTPTQYQLPGYRIVSTPPQFTPCLHLALLPNDTASVDQVSTISTLLTTFLYYMLKNLGHLVSLLPQFFTKIQWSPPVYWLSFYRLPLSINYQDTGLYLLVLSSLPICTWLYSPMIQPQWTRMYHKHTPNYCVITATTKSLLSAYCIV